MTNSSKIGIVLSFFGLWIATFFSSDSQQIIGFAIIFLFGILHGSNDLLLISKIEGSFGQLQFRKTLLYYLVFISVGVLFFLGFPALALTAFILVSSYHFGEQHWNELNQYKPSLWITWFQSLYGLFLFALLFYFHQKEVATIMYQIAGILLTSSQYTLLLCSSGIALLGVSCVVFYNKKRFSEQLLLNSIYLLLFTIIFFSSSLIWAFAIYFVIWHSIPSLKEQIRFLYGSYTFSHFIRYCKAAFAYWLLSILGIVLLYGFVWDKELFHALFFSFLAAITFPHTVVISKMIRSKR